MPVHEVRARGLRADGVAEYLDAGGFPLCGDEFHRCRPSRIQPPVVGPQGRQWRVRTGRPLDVGGRSFRGDIVRFILRLRGARRVSGIEGDALYLPPIGVVPRKIEPLPGRMHAWKRRARADIGQHHRGRRHSLIHLGRQHIGNTRAVRRPDQPLPVRAPRRGKVECPIPRHFADAPARCIENHDVVPPASPASRRNVPAIGRDRRVRPVDFHTKRRQHFNLAIAEIDPRQSVCPLAFCDGNGPTIRGDRRRGQAGIYGHALDRMPRPYPVEIAELPIPVRKINRRENDIAIRGERERAPAGQRDSGFVAASWVSGYELHIRPAIRADIDQ